MSEERREAQHMSARGAQAAAVRWEERHPEAEIEHAPPAAPAEPAREGVPNRHSASAEAAALRLAETEEVLADGDQAQRVGGERPGEQGEQRGE